jgi:hypothetical protein
MKRRRFPLRIAANVSEEVGVLFEQLAASGDLSESDLARIAFSEFLQRRGLLQRPHLHQAAE